MSGTPSAEDKALKVRSLLASYYNADADESDPYDSNRIDASPARTPSTARTASTGQLSRGGSTALSPLNSAYTDPDIYLRRMLKETRLAELTGKHRAMLQEVGSLDSDMQTLVYENYNKFVAATDTIKVMNSSMGGLDSDMSKLKQLIDGVVDRSNAVNSKLQHRQEHIEGLNQVRMLLHKLQGVFDLPKKLRTAIDKGAYEVAVDSYAEVAPLLKKYGHKAAFKKVTQEVEACAKELSSLLRQQLLARPDEAAECIQMIARLGEPTESLQEDFLACKRQRMEGWLQTAGLALKTIAVESGLLDPAELGSVDDSLRQRLGEWFPGEGLPSLYKVIIELDSRFLTELTHTAAMYAELFEPGGRKRLVKMARDVFQRYLKLARRALADAAATAAAAAAGISTKGAPLRPLADLFEAMQQMDVEGALAAAVGSGAASGVDVGIATDWGTSSLMKALYVVKNDISRLDSMLPELSPKDRAAEVVEHTVRHHAGLCFAALERRVLATVDEIRGELVATDQGQGPAHALADRQLIVQRGSLILQDMIMLGLDRVLLSLKHYERERWALQSWLDVFGGLVRGQLQNLFLSTLHQLLVATLLVVAAGAGAGAAVLGSGGPVASIVESAVPFVAVGRKYSLQSPATPGGGDPAAPPPILLLLLSQLCQFMEREALAHVLSRVQDLYPSRMGRDEPPGFIVGELGRQLSSASGTFLRGYVDAYGRLLAIAVRRSMEATDWANHKEPRAPRLVCDYILEKAAEVDAEVACVTESLPRSATHSRTSSLHHSSSGTLAPAVSMGAGAPLGGGSGLGLGGSGGYGSMGLAGGMAGAGGGSGAASSGALELSKESLEAAILAGALRSLIEAVRLVTLGRTGFQQVQLDVHYLRPRLQEYAGGGREVIRLLDELLGAAWERSDGAVMLDTAVLDRIIASRSR